jgi:hypothetical protein
MAEPIAEYSTEAVLNVAKTERTRVLHVYDDQAFLIDRSKAWTFTMPKHQSQNSS